MGFVIKNYTQDHIPLIEISDDHVFIQIVPSAGALLHSYTIKSNQGSLNCLEQFERLDEIIPHFEESYRSAKLSPFACRIDKGQYHFHHKSYEFPDKFFDGSAIHGILYNRPFTIVDQHSSENDAGVRLQHIYQGDNPGYPFPYECTIEYRLFAGGRLQISTYVKNISGQAIPIADGWHHYFTLAGKVNDWQLQLDADQLLGLNSNLIPDGSTIHNKNFETLTPIRATAFDTCFIMKGPGVLLYNPENHWELTLHLLNNYKYIQIFTPDHRNSIAIEPLSGAPDCFNNQQGLKVLEPGESIDFCFSMHLQNKLAAKRS